jgi:hypothetical protein
MSDQPMSKSRRDAVKLMAGTAVAIPVINLVGMGSARAAAPANAVTPDDPTAIALKYSEDATKADRAAAARPGKPPAEQTCSVCQFMQPAMGEGDWKGCTLFPGKLINVNGWCMSWTLKTA